jgi:hypothetical protein
MIEQSPVHALLVLTLLALPFTDDDLSSLNDFASLLTVLQCAAFVGLRTAWCVKRLAKERQDRGIEEIVADGYFMPVGFHGLCTSVVLDGAVDCTNNWNGRAEGNRDACGSFERAASAGC